MKVKHWTPPRPARLFPDEGLGGYLIRYCELNSWVSLVDFAKGLVVTMRHCRTQAGSPELLELRLGLEPGSIPLPFSPYGQVHGNLFNEEYLPSRHFRAAERAVCRRCLLENGYMRGWWDIELIETCHIHNEALHTDCCCGRPLTWRDTTLRRCERCVDADVVHDFPGKKQTPTEFEMWLLRRLGVVDEGPHIPELEKSPLSSSISFLEDIGKLEAEGYASERASHDGQAAQTFRRLGATVLRAGRLPALLERVAAQYLEQTARKPPGIPSDSLGWFGQDLRERYAFILRGIEKDVLLALSAGLGYTVRNLGRRHYLPIDELAELTDRSPARLLKALQNDRTIWQCKRVDDLWLVPVPDLGAFVRRYKR